MQHPRHPHGEGQGHARRVRREAYAVANRLRVAVAGNPAARGHVARLLKGLGGGIGYAALIEPRWVEMTQVDVGVAGLPPELDGYRILHLTDVHFNMAQGRSYLERVVEKSNSLDPDMVALTGDFITHDARRMEPCLELLSGLRAPDGLWAVRGNHDAVVPLDAMERSMGRRGIRLLENAHEVVRVTRTRGRLAPGAGDGPGPRMVVAGTGDLWTGHCSPGLALAGADPSLPSVVMSHNPAGVRLVPDGTRVDLMLSGHTHGGQVRPFRRAVPIFASGEEQLVAGLVRHNGTTVYISRGVGTSALHLRWNCRPEVALLVLRPARAAAGGEAGHA